MKHLLLLAGLLINTLTFAQEQYNPIAKPNTYRNADNPNYWKNKMPHAAYWQQDVHYKIKANINEQTDIISGNETLTYWNNSPDNLDFVYFHLYQNAFQPDSYLDELHKKNGNSPKYGEYEKQKLGTVIEEILVNGEKAKTILDNTILKVYLPTLLNSKETVTFKIKFKTYFDEGEVRRRMKVYDAWGNRHYNGVHWYPRISVYDAKFGWTTDQHLGREFYGDFGCYDVELTFASNYVVGATGFLQNREEVLPNELRDKLNIKNFKDKLWNSAPSIITEYKEGERKTWIYHAENVHDFAFTADPTYRIGEAWWKDKVCYSLVQEPHSSKWQNAADYAAKCVEIFSEDFGMYTYHKMIVADARDGMEYPMLTLDSGSDPGYRGLLVHEIGHNWFFGQVGNNETYRALLDEGFTQFLTAWGLIKIDGEYLVKNKSKNKFVAKHTKPTRAIDSRVYYAYINDATKHNDPKISTHSDCFNGALRHGGGYRHVYYKTASMLYNLQYVLGDDLFLESMQYYFKTWKIAHPYNEDFRNAIIQFTKVDLNWFFDQWLETSKRIDYAIDNVTDLGNDYHAIQFERKGRMQMPIDFRVIAKNGKEYNFHIPNNWFVKNTNAVVLPKWHGWDKLNPEYTARIKVPTGIKNVIIDPTSRLADAYMLDNSQNFPVTYNYDTRLWRYPSWRDYEIKFRPDIWWNSYDGIKIGLYTSGGYMNHHHLFDASIWINTAYLQTKDIKEPLLYDAFSYRLNYNTNLDKIFTNSRISFNTQSFSGLYISKLGLSKTTSNQNNKLSISLFSMYRPEESSKNYLLYPKYWGINKLNNRIDFSYELNYRLNSGKGKLKFEIKNSSMGSEYNYNLFCVSSINNSTKRKLNIRSRTFIQFGSGTNWAPESKLFLAGGNPEELMHNKFTRETGFFPSEWMGYDYTTNSFHSGGGLNLRGYAGYLAPEFDENGIIANFGHMGTSGASINIEVDFSNYLPYELRYSGLKYYAFADAGVITSENLNMENLFDSFNELRADAGFGLAYSFDSWGPLETVKPITIRFDMPLFLNKPPATNEDFLQFRWILGVNRAF
jgi:aminopeptidase N